MEYNIHMYVDISMCATMPLMLKVFTKKHKNLKHIAKQIKSKLAIGEKTTRSAHSAYALSFGAKQP